MKKTILGTTGPLVLAVALFSCGSSSGKQDMQNKLQQQAQTQLEQQSPKKQEYAGEGPKEAMTLAEAAKFLSASDANKGKRFTISAYPVGARKEDNGEFELQMSDRTAEFTNLACIFKEEMRDEVTALDKNKLVKITGNIAWANGMIAIKNAKLPE